jgi:hypothetical protein
MFVKIMQIEFFVIVFFVNVLYTVKLCFEKNGPEPEFVNV